MIEHQRHQRTLEGFRICTLSGLVIKGTIPFRGNFLTKLKWPLSWAGKGCYLKGSISHQSFFLLNCASFWPQRSEIDCASVVGWSSWGLISKRLGWCFPNCISFSEQAAMAPFKKGLTQAGSAFWGTQGQSLFHYFWLAQTCQAEQSQIFTSQRN